ISAAGLHHALATGEPIDDPRLPVKVEPVEWLRKSRFGPLDEGEENPATAGGAARAEQKLVRLTAATGAGGDAVALPGSYARFIDRATGKDLGVSAFNAGIDLLQKVHLPDSDVEWKADLRFQRLYKPYTVYLHSIRQNNYSGTTRA